VTYPPTWAALLSLPSRLACNEESKYSHVGSYARVPVPQIFNIFNLQMLERKGSRNPDGRPR